MQRNKVHCLLFQHHSTILGAAIILKAKFVPLLAGYRIFITKSCFYNMRNMWFSIFLLKQDFSGHCLFTA